VIKQSDLVNDRCYLSPLGNCGSKITKEHFISRTILEMLAADENLRGSVSFEGGEHFFGRRLDKIGIDSVSAKVLCDHHNSALSDIDSAVGLAFATIKAFGRDVAKIANGEVQSFHISSGLDVERWMIKVYCGLVAAGKIKSWSGQALERTSLPRPLLECLIGCHPAPAKPLGLYMNTFVGQERKTGGLSFSTIQLTDGSDAVGGLMLRLGLMDFVLVTSPTYGHNFSDPNWYRHQTFAWNVKQGRTRIAYLFTY
jgi:hypothetical protein